MAKYDIPGGLDYRYGQAVEMILNGATDEPSLMWAGTSLRLSYGRKVSYKHPSVGRACAEYRAALNGEASSLVLDTLNIVEGYSAQVGARKLEERLRRALFELRQLRLPGM